MSKDHLDWLTTCIYSCLSDALVAAALDNPSDGSVSYEVTAQNLTGYLAAGSNGINHGKGAFLTPSSCLNRHLM